MFTYYTYLISSLPMLHFGMGQAFSFNHFINKCKDFITEQELGLLMNLPLNITEYKASGRPIIEKWLSFDAGLRNELVKIRSQHKKIRPEKYLRPLDFIDLNLHQIASSAHRASSILEAEKILDEARWRFLEELSFGHYFDMDFLIIYAYKLMILERWDRINGQDKERILDEVLA